MKKFLTCAADVAHVPVGYIWESNLTRIGLIRIFLFALVSGDLNKIHINPFTFFLFNSNLGGMTCPGDMVLSITKEGIYQVFEFEEDTEVIAFGYDKVEFRRPLHVGSLFRYRYTLLERDIVKSKAKCKWKIEVVDKQGKAICWAIWANGYYPVSKSTQGKVITPLADVIEKVLIYSFTVTILLLATIGWLLHQPINEFNYPLAP